MSAARGIARFVQLSESMATVSNPTPSRVDSVLTYLRSSHLVGAAVAARRTLRRGQHLYWPRDSIKHVYLIEHGALKEYLGELDGGEHIRRFCAAGQLLGLEALLGNAVRCGAVALDTCVVCAIPVAGIVDASGTNVALWRQILHELDDSFADMESRFLGAAVPARQRLAAFLLSVARDCRDIYLPMSHRDIGTYLQLAPETVSRLLTRLQQHGFLSIQGRQIRIHDRTALKRAAAGTLSP